MRLNNYISSTGLCSRREADKLIMEQKVKINGRIAELGSIVNEEDQVEVSGKLVIPQKNDIYIALNKPVGIISTTERHIKDNIIDYVKHPKRIFPIGRLDKDSEGLILLTNDGSIVNEILAESNNHEKEYIVTVNKPITASFLEAMSKGVKIFNPVKKSYAITKKCKVIKVNERTFRIILSQGLNRQIRRMCSQFGYEVIKLKRIRIMNLTLGDLPTGKWRYLTPEEIKDIKLMAKGEGN
ncbi:pseudouridine synthase [Alkaliphilus serpentinus]|uniref:Pseudouridine synthase n=1 Tax=Alkaliphilus serpentinus TaxID=1482731 RepID=A0A833M913_9FIRM|nr:pseudouridine synthase [Alkaliphilus serpentinus]KAB3528847.1 pseudouridine synthase [Alkaliphilus serpentinus]